MSKTRVLYVCADRGIPVGGSKGASIHIREFLNAMAAAGHDTEAVVCRQESNNLYESPCPLHLLESGDTDRFFDEAATYGHSRHALREVREFYRNQATESKMKDVLRGRAFDVVYERYSLFSVAGRAVSRELSIPHLLEVNAPLVREESKYRELHLPELARSVEQYLFTTTDHVIAVSDAVARYVREIAPETPITVVPNGVNCGRFEASVDNISWRERFTGEDKDRFVIGFVGSIRPWHGVEVLIESLRLLMESKVNCGVVLIGENQQMRPTLEKLAIECNVEDKVDFIGVVPFEAIADLLGSIDVMTAPYPNLEGFYFSPLKIFEYMAAGKPIVASEIGQIRDILTNEKNALLVPPGDAAALAKAITRLVHNRKLCDELGAQAKNDAASMHTWGHRIETISGIIKILSEETPTDKVSRSCG